MVSHSTTVTFEGIRTKNIDVQVHIGKGLPSFTIVGLASKSVDESKERIKATLAAIHMQLPPKKITVNLSPANVHKAGSHYDLPIALAVLEAMQALPEHSFKDAIILGELALDGSITPVHGVLPAAVNAVEQNKTLICPYANGLEAQQADENATIHAAKHIIDIIRLIKHKEPLPALPVSTNITQPHYKDLADIKGQAMAKRALEIAAAGGHNMLMTGPPGSGKSMLAERLAGILPAIHVKEKLEVGMIYSVSGHDENNTTQDQRPFRAPHHNCSMAAMTGGGKAAKPGEVSLAHGGVLFLDELPEFPRVVLDSLRQPLETQQVTIARAENHITYPANFQLIAAMNPCKCGYLGDSMRECNKVPDCAQDYQNRLSGPFLDRIDIHVQAPALDPTTIYDATPSEASATVKQRVINARAVQHKRFENTEIHTNAQADGELLHAVAPLDETSKNLMKQTVTKMGLSMRGHNRVIRVARTIADLAGDAHITETHLAEAINYRQI